MDQPYYCNRSVCHQFLFQAFTGVFITEALIKLSSQGRNYFKSRWNIFDLLVVLLGIFDFTLSADSAVTVLRAFKIVSVKLIAVIAVSIVYGCECEGQKLC